MPVGLGNFRFGGVLDFAPRLFEPRFGCGPIDLLDQKRLVGQYRAIGGRNVGEAATDEEAVFDLSIFMDVDKSWSQRCDQR